MTSKSVHLIYWISTILFVALILFASFGGIKPSEDVIKIFHDGLGYPIYFIRFISIAKVLGCIAILVPGFIRIKEWAYAGLFFDLTGAVYSGIAVSDKFDPMMLTLLIWIVPGVVSYHFWRKKISAGSISNDPILLKR
jgi:hypothetical protein